MCTIDEKVNVCYLFMVSRCAIDKEVNVFPLNKKFMFFTNTSGWFGGAP